MNRRLLSLITTSAALALGIGAYAIVADADPTGAVDKPIPEDVREAVQQAATAPGSPLRTDAAASISTALDAAPGGLTFFRAPTADGGSCLVTSSGIVSSCLTASVRHPGTVTLIDDSEADEQPAIVYGQIEPSVTGVSVVVAGKTMQAAIGGGMYTLTLPDARLNLDSVKQVNFTLTSGRTVSRVIHP